MKMKCHKIDRKCLKMSQKMSKKFHKNVTKNVTKHHNLFNPCGESDQLVVHFNFAKNG